MDIAAHHSLHLSGRWSSSNVQVQWRLDLLPGIQVSWMEDMMRGAMSQSLQSGLALPVGIVGGHWCIPYSLFHFLDAGVTRSASTSIWIGGWRDVPHIVNSIPSTPYFRDACTSTADYITLHHEKNKKMELYSKKRMQISVASGYITKKTKKELYLFQKRNANFCRKTRKNIFLEFFWNSSRLEFQKNWALCGKIFLQIFFAFFFLEFIKI